MDAMLKKLRCASAIALAITAVACAQTPVSPAGSVTLTTATLTSPANNAAMPNPSQPGTRTGPAVTATPPSPA